MGSQCCTPSERGGADETSSPALNFTNPASVEEQNKQQRDVRNTFARMRRDASLTLLLTNIVGSTTTSSSGNTGAQGGLTPEAWSQSVRMALLDRLEALQDALTPDTLKDSHLQETKTSSSGNESSLSSSRGGGVERCTNSQQLPSSCRAGESQSVQLGEADTVVVASSPKVHVVPPTSLQAPAEQERYSSGPLKLGSCSGASSSSSTRSVQRQQQQHSSQRTCVHIHELHYFIVFLPVSRSNSVGAPPGSIGGDSQPSSSDVHAVDVLRSSGDDASFTRHGSRNSAAQSRPAHQASWGQQHQTQRWVAELSSSSTVDWQTMPTVVVSASSSQSRQHVMPSGSSEDSAQLNAHSSSGSTQCISKWKDHGDPLSANGCKQQVVRQGSEGLTQSYVDSIAKYLARRALESMTEAPADPLMARALDADTGPATSTSAGGGFPRFGHMHLPTLPPVSPNSVDERRHVRAIYSTHHSAQRDRQVSGATVLSCRDGVFVEGVVLVSSMHVDSTVSVGDSDRVAHLKNREDDFYEAFSVRVPAEDVIRSVLQTIAHIPKGVANPEARGGGGRLGDVM